MASSSATIIANAAQYEVEYPTDIMDEASEELSLYSNEDIANLINEDISTGNNILTQNSLESNVTISEDTGASNCNSSADYGNILLKDDDGKEYILIPIENSEEPVLGLVAITNPGSENDECTNVTILKTDNESANILVEYNSRQYYQVPVIENVITDQICSGADEKSNHNLINSADNCKVNTEEGGDNFPFTYNISNKIGIENRFQNVNLDILNDEQIAVERFTGLQQPVITLDNSNLNIVVSPDEMQLINENSDEDINSSNENSQTDITKNTTLMPLSTQKRKKIPLYAQAEPEDEDLRARWKRARTTEHNRREKSEKSNMLEKEVNKYKKLFAECQEKLNKSEEMRKNSEAKNEALTKEIKEKNQYISSQLKYTHEHSYPGQFVQYTNI